MIPAAMPLRMPQDLAIAAALAALGRGQRSGLWVLPTGLGKTAAFLHLARILSVPVCVLVHRDVLVRQTVRAASLWWPEASVGVIQGERDEWGPASPLFGSKAPDLVIASVQSLHADRLARIPPDRFGLLIADEAHYSVSPSWTRAIRHFRAGFMLGVTATPDRLDRKGLHVHFGREPLYHLPLRQAIEDGYLVHILQAAVETQVDLDAVKLLGNGKWDTADLSVRLSIKERNDQVVKAYKTYASDRRAIVFAVDVEHVRSLADAFSAAGVSAVPITGEDVAMREAQLDAFARDQFRVAVNCEVLNAGFDDPPVSCILMARPTKSRLFYIQAVGRGLRLSPETKKKDCLVLDFVDASRQHKLVTVCDLVGWNKGHDARGQDVLCLARQEEYEQAERASSRQRELIVCPLTWRLKEVSPWPDMPSLHGYQANRHWQGEPATDRQLQVLRRCGVEPGRVLTRGEASWLIERAKEYDMVFPRPPSPRMQHYLEQCGEWTEGLTWREARQRISRLKQEVG